MCAEHILNEFFFLFLSSFSCTLFFGLDLRFEVSVLSLRFRSENWWKSLFHQHSFLWVCFVFILRSFCFGYNKSRTFGMVLGSSDFIGCHALSLSAHLFSCWSFNLPKRDGEQKQPRFIFYRALSVLFIVHSLNNTIELIECSQMLGTWHIIIICKCYRHIYLLWKRSQMHLSVIAFIVKIAGHIYWISRNAEKSIELIAPTDWNLNTHTLCEKWQM